MNIGIIGFGRFGKLMTRYLSEEFEVFVYDRKGKEKEIEELGGMPVSLEKACKKDIVIPSVPISVFENVMKTLSPLLSNNLVVDVCSVKEHPVNIMKQHLPETVSILGTHPMFGPDSAAESLKGRKIVVCKVRIKDEKYNKIIDFLKNKELNVIETTPEEHDKQIAFSQVLTQFIGRSLIEFNAEPHEIDTEGYKRLMHILGVVKNDTWQLFEDMNYYNKYSEKMRKEFVSALDKVNRKVE